MKAALKLIGLGLVVAAVAHLATVFVAPYPLMDAAMDRISRGGTRINQWLHAPRVNEDARRVVRPSPDLAYSACVYDLADGPLHVTAAPWDDYMSVSVFAANSDNIFVVNDHEAPNGVDFVLIRAGDERPEGVAQVVESPSRRGIILQRRIAPTAERFATAEAARQQDVCEHYAP
jgi:uncharacterized membrane protein